MSEFVAWPKTARLNRDIVITEKIDGTNAAVAIVELTDEVFGDKNMLAEVKDESQTFDTYYGVWAQSRKRLITPQADNAGFAKWVADNAETLVRDLGPGRHFGEWWGQGIQRKYGMDHKVFSLFNTSKWGSETFETRNLATVPVLYEGLFSFPVIDHALWRLKFDGSHASNAWGSEFRDPEGICIYHTAANTIFKVTLQDDEAPKSLANS